MTHKEGLKLNEKYFTKIASMTNNYFWPDKGHMYKIDNGDFICPTQKSYSDLKGATPSTFHKHIKMMDDLQWMDYVSSNL